MNKEMIVSSNGHETMVAILEDDLVSEIFVERERQRGVVGNVYKGRVSKVLPGMQSAFVDIGLERDGFLYVADVVDTIEEFERLEAGDERGRARKAAARREREAAAQPKIEDLLKEGQEILVQVAKEPLGTKGARLTSHVTMAGPVPRLHADGRPRRRLAQDRVARGARRACAASSASSASSTASPAASSSAPRRPAGPKEDIVSDLELLPADLDRGPAARRSRRARRRSSTASRASSPSCCATCSPTTTPAIRIDDAQEYQRVAASWSSASCRRWPARVKLYDKPFPIFEEYGVQAGDRQGAAQQGLAEVGRLHRHQPDRGAGRDRRQHRALRRQEDSGRLEDTIVKTNLEAVKEIVRQIRLRDLGGIIVLDFIDMEEKKNRQKVFQAVEQELKKDRSPSKALQVSDFGLIIITRKRVKQSLERVLTEPCPYCSGSGVDQVELDDLLRDPGRGEEDRPRPGRPRRGAAREPGHRARAEGRGERRAARPAATLWARTSPSSPTSSCTTSSST